MRACASGRRRSATSSAHSIGRSGRRPSRQTKRKIRCTASGVQSQASARRRSGSGLNGCSGGILNGMPRRCACQTAKRYVNTRLRGISAGPLWPCAASRPREQHRAIADAGLRPEQAQLFALQVRERRDEIEVPVGGGHRGSCGCRLRRAGEQRPYRALLLVVQDAPHGDLVERALAASAPAACRVHHADADAGRRHRRARRKRRHREAVMPRADSWRRARAPRATPAGAAGSRRCSGPRGAAASCRRRSRCRGRESRYSTSSLATLPVAPLA